MPKSRHNKAKEVRLARRLEEMTRRMITYEQLLRLTDDALEGAGLQATYFDQPVPHVVIDRAPVGDVPATSEDSKPTESGAAPESPAT